jgi:hypothetical protein
VPLSHIVLENSTHFKTLDITKFLTCSFDISMGTITGTTHKTIFSFSTGIGLCYVAHYIRACIALGYGLDDQGFESQQLLGIFLFTTASRPALEPTQLPIQWVSGALSLGINWPGRESDHSTTSSAVVKESVELCFHYPNTSLWRGAQLSTGPTLPFIELVYGLHDQGFDSQQGLGIFLFTTASRPVLGPTQPPIQWVPAALSLGLNRPGRESDHSATSSGVVKECVELCFHCPNTYLWRGA